MKQRDECLVEVKVHKSRPVNLVCDSTFYGKIRDKLGTVVFKDVESKEMLIWKHIESEIVNDYRYSNTNVSLSSEEDCTKIYYNETKTGSK